MGLSSFPLWPGNSRSPVLGHHVEKPVSVGVFYLSMVCLQHFAGMLTLHAGRPLPTTSLFGLGAVVFSSGISRLWTPALSTSLLHSIGDISSHERSTRLVKKSKAEDFLLDATLGVACFTALERNFFRTAVPSSILSKGVYARWGGSVLATSEAATQGQKKMIQLLGRRHGCHHCGYRPLTNFAGRLKYIADHMPPTNQVYVHGKTWWGKLSKKFLSPIQQQLLPQCRRCCEVQASSARSLVTKPIYHYSFRSWHLAPALALMLSEQEDVKAAIKPLTDSISKKVNPWLSKTIKSFNNMFL